MKYQVREFDIMERGSAMNTVLFVYDKELKYKEIIVGGNRKFDMINPKCPDGFAECFVKVVVCREPIKSVTQLYTSVGFKPEGEELSEHEYVNFIYKLVLDNRTRFYTLYTNDRESYGVERELLSKQDKKLRLIKVI